jgi:hypothetical protein
MDQKPFGTTLWDQLGLIPDHREASGLRFTLQSILGISVGAVLSGRTTLAAIARWGRGLSQDQLQAFGVLRDRAPCHTTYFYVFKELDLAALEKALGAWVGSEEAPDNHVAIDGKTARGSRHGKVPGVHLLSMYSDSLHGVLDQRIVPSDTNEITAALELLSTVTLEGKVITGDAIFTQKSLCETIVRRGGDYFFTVKSNQPQLEDDIATMFAEPFSPSGAAPLGGRGGSRGRSPQGARAHRAPGGVEPGGCRRLPRLAWSTPGVSHHPSANPGR